MTKGAVTPKRTGISSKVTRQITTGAAKPMTAEESLAQQQPGQAKVVPC